ncbi:MAG: hypothetical protein HOQ21_13805, partial [Dermatophilaceae bacterium]|nr:hypothetical protein [Dermatophilaceae bacterium]
MNGQPGAAVVIGAGSVGIAAVAAPLTAASVPVVLVSHSPAAARCLQAGVRIVEGDAGGASTTTFRPAAVLCSDDVDAVGAAIAAAACVVVAVPGVEDLSLARLLWSGLRRRETPVDVIVCTNVPDEARRLADLVGRLGPTPVGHRFAGALVDQIVTCRMKPVRGLTLRSEGPRRLVVDGAALHGSLPGDSPWASTGDFAGEITRKLCTFSAGHAAAAYVGGLRGHRRVEAALRDPEVELVVREAIREGQAALSATHPVVVTTGPTVALLRRDPLGGSSRHTAELDELVARYANPVLRDTVARVGRDPRRKLARTDRICRPALLALESGGAAYALAVTAAAASVALRADPTTPPELRRASVGELL